MGSISYWLFLRKNSCLPEPEPYSTHPYLTNSQCSEITAQQEEQRQTRTKMTNKDNIKKNMIRPPGGRGFVQGSLCD